MIIAKMNYRYNYERDSEKECNQALTSKNKEIFKRFTSVQEW